MTMSKEIKRGHIYSASNPRRKLKSFLDISGCGLLNLEVLFVSETNGGYQLAFDLVRFRTSGHLSCGGIVNGRLGQIELSSIYEQGRRVLDKYELERGEV